MTLRFGTDGVRGVANVELTVRARHRARSRRGARARRRRSRSWSAATRVARARCSRPRWSPASAPRAPTSCSSACSPRPASRTSRRERGAPAAVISASHNPFGDNGIKLFAPGGRKIPESLEREVEQELRDARGQRSPSPGPRASASACRASTAARSTTTSPRSSTRSQGRQLDRPARGARLRQRRRVPRRAHRAACARCDGRRDPRVARRRQHQRRLRLDAPRRRSSEAVLVARADAGLAFDGDADRVIAVDERGALVDGDEILAIAAHRPPRPQAAARRRDRRHRDVEPRAAPRARALRHRRDRDAGRRPQRARRARAAQPRARRRAVGARDLRRPRHHRRRHPHRHLPARHDGPPRPVAVGAGVGGHPGARRCCATSRSTAPTRSPATPRSGAACATSTTELGDDGRVLVRPSGTEPLVRVMVEATDAEAAEAAADRLVDLVRARGGPFRPGPSGRHFPSCVGSSASSVGARRARCPTPPTLVQELDRALAAFAGAEATSPRDRLTSPGACTRSPPRSRWSTPRSAASPGSGRSSATRRPRS